MFLALSALEFSHLQAASKQLVVVSTSVGLQAALTSANAGKRIHLVPGTYLVNGPLVVPDDTILEGEGVMLGAEAPDGFQSGTETRIAAASVFAGDLLTLGDGTTIRGLIVEDIERRSGNVVAVHSRMPGDRVSARIEQCELINPNPNGAGPDGPLGRGLVVLTQNRQMKNAPSPDEDADVTATLTQSIIRSKAGASAIFAINFASRGNVKVSATSNRLFGSLEVTAGVSRPDEVKDGSMTVLSERNLYAPLGDVQTAWTLDGGSTPPVSGYVGSGTSGNVLRFTSIGDRIEGFPIGVVATAAKRHSVTEGLVSENRADIRLIQLQLNTQGDNSADIILRAAQSDDAYNPGDNNTLRVLMVGVDGSGLRQNSYADEVGPGGAAQNLGIRNSLEVVGTSNVFNLLNSDIDPGPPAQFFIGEQ